MRMRKLSQGQSVVFFVPAEIRQKITALRGTTNGGIGVADVLLWSIDETWQELRRLAPLWATQGLRHQHHQHLWESAGADGASYQLSSETAKQFIESTPLILREQYGRVRETEFQTVRAPPGADGTALEPQRADLYRQIRERAQLFGVCEPSSLALDGEHERELSTEAEERRQMPQLPPLTACNPSLHKDVEVFIMTGALPAESEAFMPVLHSLANSSIGSLLARLSLPPTRLYVTADFARVVEPPTVDHMPDQCHRPVQWVAIAPHTTTTTTGGQRDEEPMTAVILSPWEANALLPAFNASQTVATLHLFGPRTSLEMRPVEDLTLYTTPQLPPGWVAPRSISLLLMLFSGQLYLSSYEDYVGVHRLLGMPHPEEDRVGGSETWNVSPSLDGESQDGNYRDQCRQSQEDAGHGASNAGENGSANDETVPSGHHDDDDDDNTGTRMTIRDGNRNNFQFFNQLIWQIRRDYADIARTDIGRILAGVTVPPDEFSVRSERRRRFLEGWS